MTRGVPLDGEGTEEAHHVAQIVTGTVRYLGWRVDLLSYQTGAVATARAHHEPHRGARP